MLKHKHIVSSGLFVIGLVLAVMLFQELTVRSFILVTLMSIVFIGLRHELSSHSDASDSEQKASQHSHNSDIIAQKTLKRDFLISSYANRQQSQQQSRRRVRNSRTAEKLKPGFQVEAPICAFVFNTNSTSPTTYILPQIKSDQRQVVIPREISVFLRKSMVDVFEHGNHIKVLRPRNKRYISPFVSSAGISGFTSKDFRSFSSESDMDFISLN